MPSRRCLSTAVLAQNPNKVPELEEPKRLVRRADITVDISPQTTGALAHPRGTGLTSQNGESMYQKGLKIKNAPILTM